MVAVNSYHCLVSTRSAYTVSVAPGDIETCHWYIQPTCRQFTDQVTTGSKRLNLSQHSERSYRRNRLLTTFAEICTVLWERSLDEKHANHEGTENKQENNQLPEI